MPLPDDYKSFLRVRCVAPDNLAIAAGLIPGQVVGGRTLEQEDLVLLTGQTAGQENGLYRVSGVPARDVNYATHLTGGKHGPQGAYDLFPGMVLADEQSNTQYRCTSLRGGTLDVTSLNFAPLAGGGGGSMTTEEIQDIIGDMVSGNTETGIDVIYDDGTGKLNFVVTGGGGGGGLTISDTPPSSPSHEDLWWESDTGLLLVRFDDGTSAQWVEVTSGAGPPGAPGAVGPAGPQGPPGADGAELITSDMAPPAPDQGQMWWETDTGKLFVWYDDGNSSQWVEVTQPGPPGSAGPPGPAGPTGPEGAVEAIASDTAPSSPVPNQLWWESDTGKLFLWYDDGNSAQWIEVVATSGAGPAGPTGPVGPSGPTGSAGAGIIAADTAPSPFANQMWWESDTGRLFYWYTDANSSQWVEVTATPGVGPAGPSGPTGPVGPAGSAGAEVVIADAAPLAPNPNQMWWESDTGRLYVWFNDGSSSQWVEISGAQGPAGVGGPIGPTGPAGPAGLDGGEMFISDTAPLTTAPGQMWWESDSGKLFVWYSDGSSSQWVEVTVPGAPGANGATGPAGTPGSVGGIGPTGPAGSIGPTGPAGIQGSTGPTGAHGADLISSDTAPPTPDPDQMWWESDTGRLYVWYNDGTSSQWVEISSQPGPAGAPGAVGPTGPQGSQGIQGIAGATGPQGPLGPTGSQGAGIIAADTAPAPVANQMWWESDTGKLFYWYTDANSSQWVEVSGAPGIAGPTGPLGPTGPQGIQGVIGPTGPQGTAGTAGTIGPTGPQGIAGPTGATGAASTVAGPVGPTGPAGPSVTVSDTAPASPTTNNLWWESDTGRLFVWFNDGDSSQWVEVIAGGAGGDSEAIQDIIGAMVSGNTETGISVTYDDALGKLNFVATGSGDVTGPASSVADAPVLFNGTTGKIIKETTYAAFKTSLSLTKTDVGLGSVDNLQQQPIDATLTALAAIDTTAGYVIQTGTDTFTKRSLAVTAPITLTNPAGTAASSTIALDTVALFTSPALTVTPTAPTATAGTATTQIATTAFVGAAVTAAAIPPATVNPLMDGAVAVGTTTKYAREDHRHPVDTSREAMITAGTTAQYWRGDKSWQTLDKASVGLGNVDNTSDASKPVSTLQAAADATKQPLDATLTALAAFATNGILTQTAADVFAGRTITGGTGITVTNGDGVAANPTIAVTASTYQPLDATITALAGLDSTLGYVVQTAVDVFTKRSLAAGTGITISNPAGTAGNSSIAVDTATIFTNTALTGTPTATTPTYPDNDTSIATTAYVTTAIDAIASVTVSDTAPTSPTPANGDLWWESDSGKLLIRYHDGTSNQWVEAAPSSIADEAVQDVVGAMIGTQTNITVTYNDTTGKLDYVVTTGTGLGDVVGPASSIADAPALFSGTTGKLIKETTYAALLASLGVSSGTYTPTLTNTSNVGASTSYVARYMRVGNIVSVSGRLDINPSVASTLTQIGISLPIASNFTAGTDCLGPWSIISDNSGIITADATNDRALGVWNCGAIGNKGTAFSFMYTVQ